MSGEISIQEQEIMIPLVPSQESSSGEELPISEWSSLNEQNVTQPVNKKRALYEKGLYSLGSEDICDDYISMSNSSLMDHPYYNYPAVIDPGIEDALFESEPPVMYPDDGQKLYLHLCSEMNLCPVRIFYKNLLSPVNNVSYYGVNPRGVRAMAMALQNNVYVTCLNMTDNFLNDDACYHLGQMLKNNTTLQELILEGCRIGASGLPRLGANFYLNHTLVSLNLARNNLGDSGGVAFAKYLDTGFYIKNVNLSKNNLGQEFALALVEGLEWKNPFTHLDLSCNSFIHVPSTVKMFGQLAYSEYLQELNLSFNSFRDQRVAGAIYDILSICTLTVLDLSNNRFKGKAIDIIIAGLINAKQLITFNLSNNPMTPEDAYNTLQKMLWPGVKLQQLLMENICVDKSFLVLLARVTNLKYRKNCSIVYGYVLQNWTAEIPDQRELLLKRAVYLGKSMRRRTDMVLYFLRLKKEYLNPVPLKTVLERCESDKVALSEDFVKELSLAFGRTKKSSMIDFNLICEYLARLWPDKKLPPTPTPTLPLGPASESIPKPSALKPKGKRKH